jgi:hypothetical protein
MAALPWNPAARRGSPSILIPVDHHISGAAGPMAVAQPKRDHSRTDALHHFQFTGHGFGGAILQIPGAFRVAGRQQFDVLPVCQTPGCLRPMVFIHSGPSGIRGQQPVVGEMVRALVMWITLCVIRCRS